MADITLEQFEKEALAWLEANAERRPVEKAFVWGEGADNFYREKDRGEEAKNAEAAKVWRQKKFDAGYGWIKYDPNGKASWIGQGASYTSLIDTPPTPTPKPTKKPKK